MVFHVENERESRIFQKLWMNMTSFMGMKHLTASSVCYNHSQSSRQHELHIDCTKENTSAVINRNDHTKIDLDDARLIPTDDLERVYS